MATPNYPLEGNQPLGHLPTLRKVCFRLCWTLQDIIVPTLRYAQYLYEDVLKSHVNPNIKWLDLGCGHQLLPIWRISQEKEIIDNSKILVGIDYDLISLLNHRNINFKIQGSITNLPFRDNSFNLVTANMVIEHLKNPYVVLQEVKRILIPQGIFIFHTPNAFGYNTIIARCIPEKFKKRLIYFLQGRREEDSFQTYYMLNTKNKIISLARETGFQISKIKMVISTPQLTVIPPVALIELFLLRILMAKMFEPIRTNIITILKKE